MNAPPAEQARSVVVGIAEMAISSAPSEVLVTYSLGSCLGLTLYDPAAGLAGMIHCVLPLSRVDPESAAQSPCRYVDTGVGCLLDEMLSRGAKKDRIIAKAAGCGAMNAQTDSFETGRRNHTVMKKLLWKNSILLEAEDVGGSQPRTMSIVVATGRVTIKSRGQLRDL